MASPKASNKSHDNSTNLDEKQDQGRVRRLTGQFEGNQRGPGSGTASGKKPTFVEGKNKPKEKEKGKQGNTTKKSAGKTNPQVRANNSEDAWVCSACSKSFADPKDLILECEVCHTRTCHECLSLSPRDYGTLSRKDVIWMCGEECTQEVSELICM